MNKRLERKPLCAYHSFMVDISQHAPAGWLEALERSEAQLAAGQVVSGDEVIRELHASIARMEAKRAAKPAHRTAPHR